ncbi:hypothetical protein [Actinosynnema mirum]|uniref:Uncharacterized protein n=1 Tax=Actinosynnema mirum (strain ATCC 29888 / DSM 43827 / JCM 3225 / NBRC 14064 / NCIMB 13271 / NRRL B-12336 / IMRU 3971 / 101) TaxID=446462 RepID=C6WC62_ACTMD|nr:hypothetical protein [Actinosynnema mirum]ACU39450.1 hypothetical protein Amir_5634 [Actinosynnema mirum DSM 43827]
MPAVDLAARVRRLTRKPETALAELLDPGGLRHWGPHQENTARLLEIQSYGLVLDWRDRTFDPESDEAREARRALLNDRRHGVRPPADPPVPPIAHRPAPLAQQMFDAFVERTAAPARPDASGPQLTTVDEFIAAWEL